MSYLLVIAAFAAGLAAAVAKGILGKEIQGRIERRIVRSVETTIESLPPALREEWADEWRAELAATLGMPLSAAALARGLRFSAAHLVSDLALAQGGGGTATRRGHWRARIRDVGGASRQALRKSTGRIASGVRAARSDPQSDAAAVLVLLAWGIIVLGAVAIDATLVALVVTLAVGVYLGVGLFLAARS